jgi:type II secretory pathway component GspD/PulD (secretin)
VQVPILTRSAITALYLSNGQTTVIGGLSSETKGRQEEGVPVLKNIPGLGAMFRNQSDRNSFSDTLIFITPHILPKFGNRIIYGGK